MIIVHWKGKGYGMMAGIKEYIDLYETREDLSAEYADEAEALKDKTAPGFELVRIYDTDIDTDFAGLPLGETLAVHH